MRQQCEWIGDRYFPSTERNRANDLIDRIINQNEAALGIFYLHPEASIGIAESSIVLLRVSIALRAAEHYDTLVAARRGRLHPEFANKLGWLCGNLHSRVGIRDWKENEEDQKMASEIKRTMLDDGDGPTRVVEGPTPLVGGFTRGVDRVFLRDDGSRAPVASMLTAVHRRGHVGASQCSASPSRRRADGGSGGRTIESETTESVPVKLAA